MTSEDVPSELKEGMDFLLDRGLLAPAAELDDGMLYGITEDGVAAIYMLSLIMATGTTIEEAESGVSVRDEGSRKVSRCAGALVRALDDLGDGSGQE